jgi:GWxTD domain-containing protein
LAGVLGPLTGSGSFQFSADLPVFFDEEGPRADLTIQIRHEELRFEADGGRYRARVSLETRLARSGVVAINSTQEFELFASDREDAHSSTRFQLLELPLRVPEGKWAVTLTLRDLVGEAKSLSFDGVASVAEGIVDVPAVPPRRPRLSDPEFRLWSGGERLPNPERLYGVSQDTLEAYFELSDARPGQRYVVDVDVYDPVFGGMDGESIIIVPAATTAASIYRLPLASFPAGSYRLRLTPQWAEDWALEAEFGVTWSMSRVVQTGRDVEVEGRLLFENQELRNFLKVSRSAQVQLLQRFWLEVDPSGQTAKNEIYDRFLERVAFAQRNYGAFGRPGALTDRGRIYVFYGQPADVDFQVIPLNGDDLEDSISKVHDVHQLDRDGISAKDAIDIARIDFGLRDLKRNQARIGQEGAFEMWTYRMAGEPLFPNRVGSAENIDVRFLFVDRLGTGDYRLEYSNQLSRN